MAAEVSSNTVKAYARSLEGIGKSVETVLANLGYLDNAAAFRVRLHEAAEDLMVLAKDVAMKEFNEEWGKV